MLSTASAYGAGLTASGLREMKIAPIPTHKFLPPTRSHVSRREVVSEGCLRWTVLAHDLLRIWLLQVRRVNGTSPVLLRLGLLGMAISGKVSEIAP